jgi:chromosomal replication initiator protein
MDRYIRPLRPVSFDGQRARLAAPGKFVQVWVSERYFQTIKAALEDELGQEINLDVIAEQRENTARLDAEAVAPNVQTARPRFSPNPKFSFDNYVVGDSNRLAVAGARAVADQPGDKYNPLFIYGVSGVGKTHLLHAIANELKRTRPNLEVQYISAQQFAEDFVKALQGNKIDQFRRSHRSAGVWLVDDIQFIAGKDKTQEEIYHTFNFLQQSGKQIVFTSDRVPRDLYGIEDRLRTRFEWGLVADISLPNTETRCAILCSKAEQDGLELPMDVAFHLALAVPGNIRTLEGALTRLVTVAGIEDSPLDLDFTTRFVEKYYQTAPKKPTFPQILEKVSAEFDIPITDIKGTSRKAPVVLARHVSIYLTRRITGDSWNHIASLFGDRDHTSMMHGYQKIDEKIRANKDFGSVISRLMRDIFPDA